MKMITRYICKKKKNIYLRFKLHYHIAQNFHKIETFDVDLFLFKRIIFSNNFNQK